MAEPSARYRSKFSGFDMDRGIEYALKMMEEGEQIIPIESTFDSKVDLNMVLAPGKYSVRYYKNSYDDTSDILIILTVAEFEDILIQKYEYLGEVVQRKYTISKKEWGSWDYVRDFAIVEGMDEQIQVSKSTLVFRNVERASDIFK